MAGEAFFERLHPIWVIVDDRVCSVRVLSLHGHVADRDKAQTIHLCEAGMVPKRVFRYNPYPRCGCLLFCLLAATTALMGQTNAYTVGVGAIPSAIGINPTTNEIYVVNTGGSTVSVIDGGNPNAIPRRVIVGANPIDAAVNPVTNKIYIANSDSRFISVIDGANPTAAPVSVQVETTPVAIAVNRITNTVYVVNKDSNAVSVIDGASNTVTNTIPLGAAPIAITLNPVTNKIYVANAVNTVTVIDGANPAAPPVTVTLPRGSISPTAIAVNPITNKVYVASGGTNNLTVIGANNLPTAVATGLALGPNSIAVNTVTNKIYMVNGLSNNVAVIDGKTDTLKTSVAVGNNPVEVSVNSATNQVYIVSRNDNKLEVIDGASDTLTKTINVGRGPVGVAVNPVTNKAYVVNLTDNSVSVIDGDVNVTSTLGPGSNPFGVAVNPVTNKIYVTNMSAASPANGTLLVIDGATNATTTVPAGSSPSAIAVNPVTNTVYLTNSPSPISRGSVTVINGANNSIVATVPAGLSPNNVVVNPVTNRIYASNSGGNTVTVIDGRNPAAAPATVTVGNRPAGIAIDQVTNKLYVVNISDQTVSVIDGATNTIIDTVPVATISPFSIAFNPVTNKVYVGGAAISALITVIDASNNYATSTVTTGSGAYNLAVNAITNKIYVANQYDNSVTAIDGSTNLPSRIQLLPGSPYAVAVNPVTNKIYVTERGTLSNVVAVIDGASNTLLTSVPVGNSPYFLDVNPATNRVYAANYLGNSVTAIDADRHQPVPLTTVITGVADSQTIPPLPGDPVFHVFQTVNPTPSFTVNVTSAYTGTSPYSGIAATNPPPTQLYYEVDGPSPSKLVSASGGGGTSQATYTITLPPQQIGLHVLYVYAAYGNEAGGSSYLNGSGDSPDLGNLTAYLYLVTPVPTTTTVSSSANPAGAGESVTLTATVVPMLLGAAEPTGTVSFYDGTTLLGTGTLGPVSGSYIATYATSTLTQGSHSITATYSGDTGYFGSNGTLNQTITGPPANIAATGGGNQTTVYGTPFPNPLIVKVTDSNGAGVPGATVIFTGTDLSFIPQTVTTDASGMAQVTASANAAGLLTASASVAGVSTPAIFSLTATKPVLTVKADDATRSVGQPNPTFTAVITGFVNGDTLAGAVSGSAALSTTATQTSPVGTYPIVAAVGDLAAANYTFTFVNGNLVITPSTESTTTLSISSPTVMYGNEVVLTAVVAPPGATGLVRFFENTSNLQGSASLDSTGTAVLPISGLSVGTHNITAHYEGDANVPPSTSATVQLTVTKLAAPDGGPALTVKVNDATRTTTESNPPFTYSSSGTLVNEDTYDTAITGTPTYSTSAGTLPGTFAVTVSGLTSANYTVQFLPGTLTVVETPTTTTLVTSPASIQYGDTVTLTAAVAPGIVTGNVGFFDGTTLLGQATVSGGMATLTTAILNAGDHTITAVYNGDGTYAASESAPQTVTVAKRTAPGGAPALIITVQDESRPFGTANPQFSYLPSGTLVNGDTYDTAITGAPVYFTEATPASPAGTTWPIDVDGLGSENYVVGIVKGTLTIVTSSTTTGLAINPISAQYGDPVTLTATVTPASATGLVDFLDGSIVLGTATVSGGVATLTTTAIHAGVYTVKADYLGDGNYSDSTSSPVALTIVQRSGGPGNAPALMVTAENATRAYREGDPAFNYSVSGTLVNGDTFATAVVGVPVYSTTSIVISPPGSYSITVAGLSSRDYVLGFAPGTLTVTKANPVVTLTSSQNPSTYGSSVTFTATLRLDASGSVTFIDDRTTLGTGTIASGQAILATSTLIPATHVITAQYSGDTSYNTATSSALSQVVNKATATPTVTVSPNPNPAGTPVTITATFPPGATGTVDFYDGRTAIGTAPISDGVATITVPSFSQGTHSITASYSGDANFGPGMSAPVSLVITAPADFAIANNTAAQIIPPGASASYSISITSVNAPFTNVVTLTATNLPPGATSTFSPATVTPGAAGASSTFTVSLPKQSAAVRHSSKIPLLLALMLVPFALLRRTRGSPPRLLLWLLLTVASIGFISGCGSGGYFSQSQTTYVITVTGTSGSVVHSTTATLTAE